MLDLFSALGLAMVIEGTVYALFPDAMRRGVAKVVLMPTQQLRIMGLLLAGLGFAIVALMKSGASSP